MDASNKAIIEIVHSKYPGYDKYLHSKVNNPEKYGVRRIDEAEKLIEDTFIQKPQKPVRADKHRIRYSVRMRTTKAKKTRLQQAFKRYGYTTEQSGMEKLTDYFLEHQEILG